MQQGWLCLVLLFLLGLPPYALGGDITATERELWLAEPQTQQKAEELYLLSRSLTVQFAAYQLSRTRSRAFSSIAKI